jgi:hypothetical protein
MMLVEKIKGRGNTNGGGRRGEKKNGAGIEKKDLTYETTCGAGERWI